MKEIIALICALALVKSDPVRTNVASYDKTNPQHARLICATVSSEDILVAHEVCNKFYQCWNGEPTVRECYGDLQYNPVTEVCDWPYTVECGEREEEISGGSENAESGNGGSDNVGSGTCKCNPTEAPEICAGAGSNGILIAHETCCNFYKCDNGKPVSISCPAGLLYNPYNEQCDWPDNVECGDRVISEPGSGGDNNENVGSDNGDSDNGNGGSNNYGGSGNGGTDNIGSENCNCNPTEAPELCAAIGFNGAFVAHENCNQFYTCIHGIPVSISCPGALLYNPYTEQCDWPQNVECGDRVIPKPGSGGDDNGNSENGGSDNNGGSGTCNCNPAEAPEICATDSSNGAFVAHEICNQFYTCVGGRPMTTNCSSSLLYNPYTEVCDWPENVKCGDRVIPEPDNGEDNNGNEGSEINGGSDHGNSVTCNCNPAEAHNVCAADGSDDILIAHESCYKFYKCNNGRPVSVSCHGGHLYNPYTEKCDWHENVKCGDRVIAENDIEDENNEDENSGNSSHNEESGNDDSSNESSSNANSGNDSSEMDNHNENENGGSGSNISDASTTCASFGSEGIHLSHETNCNQFYFCKENEPVLMNCSGTLMFNHLTSRCDWPHNVDCNARETPIEA